MLKEFKQFAIKGNLLDITVAFVMGAAFGKVVTSFINGIVMPLIGQLTAGVDFKSLKYVMSEATYDATGKEISPETAVLYGDFITVSIDFIIVAFVMFLMVKAVNKFKKKEAETTVSPSEPTKEEILLTEIRDLLKKS